MTLKSGPAAMDRVYWSVVTIACLAFAAYFFYDGKWGYLKKNRSAATQRLPALIERPIDQVELGDSPTKADFESLKADLERLRESGQPTLPEQVHQALGPPVHTKRTGPGETVEYFISVYGCAAVPINNDRVNPSAMAWTAWLKTKEQIQQQYYWGLIPLVIGLYAGLRAYRAMTLRVVIDEEGMTYAGKRIPFEAMTALRDYNRKGWVDLHYGTDAGEQRLRLDNQKVAKFDEIAEAICQAKGFENPVTAYYRQVEEEEAKQEAQLTLEATDEPADAAIEGPVEREDASEHDKRE
jgi:hypothetical protein